MSGSSKVCQFFASDEGCTFGAACNFSHDLSQSNPLQNAAPPASRDQPSASRYPRGQARNHRPYQQSQYQQRHAQASQRICRYFLSGNCTKGDNCTFRHEHEGYEPKLSAKVVRKQETERKSTRPCKFFTSVSGCRHGDACNFLHPSPAPKDVGAQRGVEREDANKGVRKEEKTADTTASTRPRVSEEELDKQRNTEIEMLKKRYPQFTEEEIPGKKGPGFRVKFLPTDPDWPYDVKELLLLVYFPAAYPQQMMEIGIPEDSSLPETVRRCVDFSLVDWVSARHKSFEKNGRVELMFRPFLRWLDRELEDIFTDALTHYQRELVAREAGIEIVPARHLKARYNRKDSENSNTEEETGTESQRPGETSVTIQDARGQVVDEGGEDTPPQEAESNKENQPLIDASNPVKKGTEIKLQDLQMRESMATLIASQVRVVVRCERCRHEADVTTPSGRLNSLTCAKCSQDLLVAYRPAVMHTFSSVLGYLDVKQCAAVDLILIDCQFVANCLNCSKDLLIGGMHPGQVKNARCAGCHSKMMVAVECAQLRQFQPSDLDALGSLHKVTTEKIIRNVRDPAIKEGQALPNQGSCRHYKKSYRWLRFPCCGKAYPCDTCHDDFEKGDHEMKFANRMICGFCAKEQPYTADRDCVSCGSSMTRRSSHHWEGGKGCRDVIRMSKTDDQKYSGMKKTISRHAWAKTHPKKTTKLRHNSK